MAKKVEVFIGCSSVVARWNVSSSRVVITTSLIKKEALHAKCIYSYFARPAIVLQVMHVSPDCWLCKIAINILIG